MKLADKHFINPKLLARNVLEVDVPADLLDSLGAITEEVRAVTAAGGLITLGKGLEFFVMQLANWNSDLRWISQADERSFEFFEDLFRRTGAAGHVERYVDLAKAITLYSGFFVTRRTCTKPYFHVDWNDGHNDAFNFITPLTENCGELGLLYRDMLGQERKYTYRLGKALIIGDKFLHSVEPGEAAEPVVLLSFTFGTDKMDRWPLLSKTAAHQGVTHRRPDGVFVRTGPGNASK
jgi:hypothetical protein